MGIVPPGYALLETIGRKSGKARRTPVGDARVGKQFWIVAEHGMKAGYVRNIKENPRVRLKLREGFRARWHTGKAQVLPDDDARERQRWLAGRRPSAAANAAAVRLFGTELLTVRIDLDGCAHVDSSKPSSERDFRRAGCSLHREEGEERGLGFCVIGSGISPEAWVADFAVR